MKIKPEHYEHMLAAIGNNIDAIGYRIHKNQVIRDGRAKDVEKRVRFDLSNAYIGSQWICDNIYPYADDSHIDTALRQIVKDCRFEA